MENQRLFLGAPVVVNFHASYVHGEGWRLTASCLRDFQVWGEVRPDEYSGLRGCELYEVIESTSWQLLNL